MVTKIKKSHNLVRSKRSVDLLLLYLNFERIFPALRITPCLWLKLAFPHAYDTVIYSKTSFANAASCQTPT